MSRRNFFIFSRKHFAFVNLLLLFSYNTLFILSLSLSLPIYTYPFHFIFSTPSVFLLKPSSWFHLTPFQKFLGRRFSRCMYICLFPVCAWGWFLVKTWFVLSWETSFFREKSLTISPLKLSFSFYCTLRIFDLKRLTFILHNLQKAAIPQEKKRKEREKEIVYSVWIKYINHKMKMIASFIRYIVYKLVCNID